MEINDQKEFLEGVLNHSKYVSGDQGYDAASIMNEIGKGLEGNLDFNLMKDNPLMNQDGSINIDLFTKYAQNLGLDPIDIVEYIMDTIQQQQSFTHMGQTIDLSSANELFAKTKKQFEEHKKSEDINNF